MALRDDLIEYVEDVYKAQWTERDGRIVPDVDDVRLSNEAVKFERATILYADLSASTLLVDTARWSFAAEIYKTYLYCGARIINSEGGEVRSYDGDRVMGVFVGESQTTSAARCGLKINYAVKKIINPLLKERYPNARYTVNQVVGIDTSSIHAARTGVRGQNDLVWVGPAANYAAKLTSLDGYATRITERAFNYLNASAKYGGDPQRLMWEKRIWTAQGALPIYRSNWTWVV